MSQAILSRPGKPTRKIQNLGWLLRNWKEVESFTVSEHFMKQRDGDVCLRAHLKDGGTYAIPFASAEVCWNFLHRPVFYGLPMQWIAGPRFPITKGDAFRPIPKGDQPCKDAGNAAHPLVWNVTGYAYRRGGVWYVRQPDSGCQAMRYWRLVTDPTTTASLNDAYAAGSMTPARTYANPVKINVMGGKFTVENEGGDVLHTTTSRDAAERWALGNSCDPIPGTWAEYHGR